MKRPSRRTITLFLAVALLVSVVAVLAFAHTWAVPKPDIADAPRCFSDIWRAQWPKWIGCAMSAHENLAGGLIGAAGAIFAGWLAWIAVQNQIEVQKRLTTILHDETFEAIKADLRDVCEHMNEIWKAIDFAFQNESAFEKRRAVASVAAGSWPNYSPFDVLERLANNLTPLKLRVFRHVLAQGRMVETDVKKIAGEPPAGIEMAYLMRFSRVQLSHFHRYLLGFDIELAAIFNGRNIADVNHENAAAHIRVFVDKRIQQGQ